MYFDYSALLGVMASQHISRSEMAKKIGLSRTYFCTILKAGKPMPTDVAFRIAKVLGIDEYAPYFFVLNVQ